MTSILFWETLLIFLINIPFGYWRINVKRLSIQWVLAIHIPVILVVALRFFTSMGFAWYTYVFMVTGFFLGQKIGAVIHRLIANSYKEASSCLFMDLYRHSSL